ncbi:MAG TPA: glycosyltransferase family 2 protein [Firmicutes bacterium]|nr:glycosyltransferase family 2 protein [Bacillota bacterium]
MSTNYGLVSIITPSYNTARFVKETIQSVLAQTYPHWEMLIVDDCSTDGSADTIREIIQEYQDPRIRLFVNKVNSGAAVSRNRALREAKGRWIAFLDSDDLWAPDKLEKQLQFMQENGCAFSYTAYTEIDEQSRETGVTVSGPKRISKAGMFRYCWPGCLTVMYDAERIGLIQIADLKKNNDYAMWLKAIPFSDCWLLDEALAKYRVRSGSISRENKIRLIKFHYILFRDGQGMNPAAAAFSTIRNLIFGIWKKVRYVQRIKA